MTLAHQPSMTMPARIATYAGEKYGLIDLMQVKLCLIKLFYSFGLLALP